MGVLSSRSTEIGDTLHLVSGAVGSPCHVCRSEVTWVGPILGALGDQLVIILVNPDYNGIRQVSYRIRSIFYSILIRITHTTPKLSVYPTEAPPEIIDMVRFGHPTNPSADNLCAKMIFSYQMPATPSSIGSGNISSTRHHTVHRADTGGGRLLQGELESDHIMTILPFSSVKICIYAVLGSCRFKWHTNLHCSDVVTTLCRFLPERKTDILQ